MAEGFQGSSLLHAPGIYLDLDMEAYVADPAVSGSGIKKLVTSPPDFKWELPGRNPLYTPPESDARALGTLVHCAVLEGMDAFAHRYFVAPELDDEDPRVIRTADHARDWLKAHEVKSTGLKADLFERVRGHWEVLRVTENRAADEGPIFLEEMIAALQAEGNGRREKIKAKSFQYVALVERTVRAWKDANELLSNGLPEVSVFWKEGDVRFKARFDWLSAAAVVDLKKFGQPPMRGRSLRSQLQRDVVAYAYDIQAVHNRRAALQIPILIGKGANIAASGPDAEARVATLRAIAEEIIETPPVFHWLFLRTPGPPQGQIMAFPDDTKRWDHAQWECEQAVKTLKLYREQCGDELDADKPWIDVGVTQWDDDDMPEYTWEIPR